MQQRLLQALRVRDGHPPELAPSQVVAGLGEPGLPAHLLDRHTRLGLPEKPDDQRWTLSAGQLIDIVKWNLLCHIPVKMRGAEDDEEETTKSFTSV